MGGALATNGFLGADVLIKIGDGATPTEVFEQFGALRNANINLGGQPVSQTTAGDKDLQGNIWNTSISGPKGLTIQGDGVIKGVDQAQIQQVTDDFINNVIRNYEITIPVLGVFTAAFVLTGFEVSAQYDDVATFSIGLDLNGAPTFVAAAAIST